MAINDKLWNMLMQGANCGEACVSRKTTAALLKAAEEAARAGVQVDVRDFAAA